MSELPRTDDLPRAGGAGVDAARVEDAFAAFAERVRELETVAEDLRAELRALRAERRAAPPEDDGLAEEHWPAERAGATSWAAPDWVGAVPPPLTRAFAVPRLVLESTFLLLVALLAGLADLSAAWIAAVMASAWALVALSEWAAAARRARWRLEDVAASAARAEPASPEDESTGPWSIPVVQATAVEPPDASESRTVVTKLPVEAEVPPAPEADAELAGVGAQAPRRGLRLWRRRPIEAAAPDPWET